MKRMLMLKSKKLVVFFPHDRPQDAKRFRRMNDEFKGCHIRDVLQAYPDGILYELLYELGTGPDGVRFQPRRVR